MALAPMLTHLGMDKILIDNHQLGAQKPIQDVDHAVFSLR
jgi:hypothetical protein